MSTNTADDIFSAANQADTRPLFWFDVPARLVKESDGITAVGFVQLTANEELMCSKLAGNSPISGSYHLVLMSLRGTERGEGKAARCNVGDGSADREFGKMDAALRSLCMTAYAELHNPKQGEAQGFLKSRRVKAG